MIPENLILLILWETGLVLGLIIILLLLIILGLLKKLVVSVTVVTVRTDAVSYDHGQDVAISGIVTTDEKPQPNTPVNLKAIDATGAEFPLPDATTDENGNFTATWTIPQEVAPGTVTLSATALGMTATTTFTFNNKTL